MNIILLSGGSGKRLWPLSNEIRSKQFIKIFSTEDGEKESMLQRFYRMLMRRLPDAKVTIATAKSQIASIHSQIGSDVGISCEPARRDTFPAIALAAAFLHEKSGVQRDEAVVVCPIDPYVEEDYFEALEKLSLLVTSSEAGKGPAALTLMGISPTYPSEKYGYIIPETDDEVSAVREFREKPDANTAARYIEEGALWNSGVFAFTCGYILDKAEELLGGSEYAFLYSCYDSLPKISFDYAVSEKEKSIRVMRFSGEWKDLGTWNTLTETMQSPVVGDARLSEKCDNVHVINETDVPILCMGLKDVVVAASPEGILVSDKAESSYIKPFVDEIDSPVRFAEKSWGSFQIINVQEEALTIRVSLHAGRRMNYHSHAHRNEVWVVTEGSGRTIVDGMEQEITPGDVVTIEAGCRHTVIADTELRLIEVQLGQDISASDKTVYPMPDGGAGR